MKFDSIKHGVEKREDQIDKMEFQKWAQDENIIIDRITDLWDIQSINPEWLAYSKVILKNWYKVSQRIMRCAYMVMTQNTSQISLRLAWP